MPLAQCRPVLTHARSQQLRLAGVWRHWAPALATPHPAYLVARPAVAHPAHPFLKYLSQMGDVAFVLRTSPLSDAALGFSVRWGEVGWG